VPVTLQHDTLPDTLPHDNVPFEIAAARNMPDADVINSLNLNIRKDMITLCEYSKLEYGGRPKSIKSSVGP